MILLPFLLATTMIQAYLEPFQAWPKAGNFSSTWSVTELVRFVVSTGHRELRMRCDGEPATLALLEACVKTCRTLGIRVVPEPTAIGDHQSNGGAERAVELIRSHANI